MATLSFQQIEALIEARGGTPAQAETGAEIVEAESGGRTDAQGDVSFGQGQGQYVGSEGIWQIFGQAHPEVSLACAEDPACSTDEAKQISDQWTNWHAWSTYNSGAYLKFAGGQGAAPASGDARTLAALPGVPDVGRAVGGLLGGLGQAFRGEAQQAVGGEIGGALHQLQPVAADAAWRIGLVVVGALLVLVSFPILFSPTTAKIAGAILPTPRRMVAG